MKLFDRLQYIIIYSFFYVISLFPLRFLYVISDLLSWLLHSVIGYRRRVVRENLVSSFPEMSENRIAAIERKFYSFLCDYVFETVKLATMSRAEVLRRLEVENIGLVNDAITRGRNVTLMLGHYCNWEWVSSLPIRFVPGAAGAQVYHHLHNHAMDKAFFRLRTRFDSHNIEMADILRRLIEWKRQGIPSVTGFIADQCPGLDIHLFVDFLNHDTGVYTGPERIARFLDAEVLFCHLSRPRRGYYRLRFVPVTVQPADEPTFDITRRYFEMLEANIREAPQYWLWSHRRWKRTRADFNEHWGDQAAKMLTHL